MNRMISGWLFAACIIAGVLSPVTAAPQNSDSEDVYTILKKGNALSEKQKVNDTKLGVMEKDVQRKTAQDVDLKGAEAKWYSYASDFNQRCQRNFYQGEEGVMAACQKEHDSSRPRDEELKDKRKSIDAWFSDYKSLKQEQIDLRSDIGLWKSKVKIMRMLRGCEASATELEALVYAYQVCFDNRK
jgi:hypothetical protein